MVLQDKNQNIYKSFHLPLSRRTAVEKSKVRKVERRSALTRNQIEYWKLQEQKRYNSLTATETHRSNVAQETETSRHNVATEATEAGKLRESNRHNLVTEANERYRNEVYSKDVGEKQRHNLESESISRATLNETIRHNTRSELTDLMRAQASLTTANAAAKQAEVARANLGISAYIAESGRISAEASRTQADVAAQNATTNFMNYGVNVATQQETARHNVATEQLARDQATATSLSMGGSLSKLLGGMLK